MAIEVFVGGRLAIGASFHPMGGAALHDGMELMPGEMSGHRIVHVLTTVRHGGAERVVLDLARHQHRLGARPSVTCLHHLGDLLPAFDEAEIPVELIEGGDRAGVARTAWLLAGSLRAARPTVVHTHNAAPQIAAGLGQRIRRWRQPETALVHTEHGPLQDRRPALMQLRRWTAAGFDAVIAVSADTQAELLRHRIHGAHGVGMVTNGIDVSRFMPPTPRHAMAAARIVHVGRLHLIKGQDVLLAAMVAIRREVPHVRLTIVGDGPTRIQLQSQARSEGIDDIVEFCGAVLDIRPYLYAADLFVLPSRSEGISLALLEAMASSIPVIATDVGGNREVIGADEFGTLVPPEQPELLARAAIALLQCPELAALKGAAGRRQVEVHFALDQTAKSYARYYELGRSAHRADALGSVA